MALDDDDLECIDNGRPVFFAPQASLGLGALAHSLKLIVFKRLPESGKEFLQPGGVNIARPQVHFTPPRDDISSRRGETMSFKIQCNCGPRILRQ